MCNCKCCQCFCCSCCEIKEGDYVKYSEEARKTLGTVYHSGCGKVTKIEERKNGSPLVYWGRNISDMSWLQKACR